MLVRFSEDGTCVPCSILSPCRDPCVPRRSIAGKVLKGPQVSFLLYDKDNIYITPVTVMDQNGHEIDSHLAVNVQYSEGVYMVDIVSMYTIKN